MHKKLITVVLATLAFAGCAITKQVIASSPVSFDGNEVRAQALAKRLVNDRQAMLAQYPPLPQGVADIRSLNESVAEYLAGYWVATGADENEIFSRAGRVYGEVRVDYEMRVNSGLSPKSAKEAIMPSIYARIKSSQLPAGVKLGVIFSPAMFGSWGYSDSFNADTQNLTFDARRPEMTVSLTYRGNASPVFNNQPSVGKIVAFMPVAAKMNFPFTAERMYQIKKESSGSGKTINSLISVGSDGGYYVMGEPVCKTVDEKWNPNYGSLFCNFPQVSGTVALPREITKSSPLASFNIIGQK